MTRGERERLRDIRDAIAAIDVAGLRDLIAHEYFRIQIERILEIVEHDLPPLGRAIDDLLGRAAG